MIKPRIVLLIFVSGKVVLTGKTGSAMQMIAIYYFSVGEQRCHNLVRAEASSTFIRFLGLQGKVLCSYINIIIMMMMITKIWLFKML